MARWILERDGARPRSDGLFLQILETDLIPWLRQQQIDSLLLPVERAPCGRCGGTITAFRDMVVPCLCGCAPNARSEDFSSARELAQRALSRRQKSEVKHAETAQEVD